MDELADRQMMTDVAIDRRLYGHSEAQVVVRRQEEDGFLDRTAALLAAKALSCPVEITWRDGDMAEAAPCFRGYVQHASAQRLPSLSVLTLSCVSYSKRTDLVPRFRAFQATTLQDIAEQIARTEPLFKIVNAGDLNIPIPLSLQHGETDFAFDPDARRVGRPNGDRRPHGTGAARRTRAGAADSLPRRRLGLVAPDV